MNLQNLPIIGRVLAFGPDDSVYDSLIVAGPVILLLIAIVGRNNLTVVLALSYIIVFVVHVGSQAIKSARM